jgi:addiction module RelE/StbE family toxin
VRVVWTDEALRHLQAIVDYISQDSPGRALDFAAKIESKALRLERFPESGRIVPEWLDASVSFREIIIDSYRVIYRIHKQAIEITTVYHGMRRLPSISKP